MNRRFKGIISSILAVTMIGVLATSCDNNKYEDLGNGYASGIDLEMNFYNSSNVRSIASSKDTYYYLGLRTCYLTAIDKNTGKSSVLCNKPNCLHDKETDPTKTLDCNAFFQSYSTIFYFNNKIYVIGNTINPKNINKDIYSMYEVNLDGSGHKEILNFNQSPVSSIIHRGYLYISFTDFVEDPSSYTKEKKKDMKYVVYRYDLSKPSKEPKTIFEEKGKYGRVSNLTAIGEKIYMDNNNEEEENTIVYDIKKDKTYKRKESYTYTVRQNDTLLNLKYDSTTTKVTDFDDNIIDEIPIEKTGVLYCNGEIIAIDNKDEYMKAYDSGDKNAKRTITFYDKDGNKIQDVDINNYILPVLGMDKKYLFFYSFDEENRTEDDLCVIDLSKLGTEDCKTEIYLQYDGNKNPPMIIGEK